MGFALSARAGLGPGRRRHASRVIGMAEIGMAGRVRASAVARAGAVHRRSIAHDELRRTPPYVD